MRMLVMSTMRMSAVSMIVEEEETDDVGCEAERTDDEDELRVRDFLRFYKSLDRFEEDGEAERDKEDAVDKGSKRFSALPLLEVRKCLSSYCKNLHTPYVYVLKLFFWFATLTAHSPTRSEITSFNCASC